MTNQNNSASHDTRRSRLRQFNLAPYQKLLSNLDWPADSAEQRRLLAFTSFNRREGVSTVASQLAITAASGAGEVLLIDANENHPSLHVAFNLKAKKGFADYVCDGSLDAIHPTRISNLSLMPFGIAPFESPLGMQFESLMEPIFERYEFVVFDLPAVCSGQTLLRWVPFLDHLILVVCPKTTAQMASHAEQIVRNSGGSFCGVVQNDI